ncbi:MAG TPA: gamma-glutamyl-gamma-aminobutyrate hydrolase family protein [Gemmatimonadales bacterium]|jgi:putative glutamine amidotransferase|nr:gamma-glutamyl-gamma-aminobutyrate hydrolase family protein [Gemmatimonadales bacterium]
MTVVAVTAPLRPVDGTPRVALNVAYIEALERAGLTPLVLPTLIDPRRAAEALDAVGGLVLSGGEDVDPTRYGAAPHPRLGTVDPRRDAVETELIRAALARRLPVLAICRGAQILNVAMGGTLYQDLASERPGPIDHADAQVRHPVRVDADTLLLRTLGSREITANSRHHQALKAVGEGLRVAARAPDGVIEGVELAQPASQWLLGVQWHPENLVETELFTGFARAVAAVGAAPVRAVEAVG